MTRLHTHNRRALRARRRAALARGGLFRVEVSASVEAFGLAMRRAAAGFAALGEVVASADFIALRERQIADVALAFGMMASGRRPRAILVEAKREDDL